LRRGTYRWRQYPNQQARRHRAAVHPRHWLGQGSGNHRQGEHPEERRVNELSDAEVLQIRETIDRDYQVEGDLRREVSMNIKRLMDLGSYRGLRHRAACRSAASARTPMRAPARARQRPSPARRNNLFERLTMAKEATRVRKRERKNITSGIAHVNSTFNNTMITITDVQGNTIAWSSAGPWASRARASRRPMPRSWPRDRGAQGAGTRHAHARGRGFRPRLRPRIGASRAAGGGLHRHHDPGRDADPAQWLPAAEAPPRLTTRLFS
jgi:hypothetical protein